VTRCLGGIGPGFLISERMSLAKNILRHGTSLAIGVILVCGAICFTLLWKMSYRGSEVKREFYRDVARFVAITDTVIPSIRGKPSEFKSIDDMKISGLVSQKDVEFLSSIDARFFPPDKDSTSNTIVFAYAAYYVLPATSNKVFGTYVARSLGGRVLFLSAAEMERAGLPVMK